MTSHDYVRRCSGLLMPLHVNGNKVHWTILVANFSVTTMGEIDSLQSPFTDAFVSHFSLDVTWQRARLKRLLQLRFDFDSTRRSRHHDSMLMKA